MAKTQTRGRVRHVLTQDHPPQKWKWIKGNESGTQEIKEEKWRTCARGQSTAPSSPQPCLSTIIPKALNTGPQPLQQQVSSAPACTIFAGKQQRKKRCGTQGERRDTMGFLITLPPQGMRSEQLRQSAAPFMHFPQIRSPVTQLCNVIRHPDFPNQWQLLQMFTYSR